MAQTQSSIPYRILQAIYDNTLRPVLPRKIAVANGVAVRNTRLLDVNDTAPNWEDSSVDAIQEYVEPDDRVVIIGGGLGVTAVHAARQGARSVLVYEGAKEHVELIEETATLNQTPQVSVEHAIVGNPIDVWGTSADVHVFPTQLPECDVLEIDAEGSELSILRELTIYPRVLIVESHGFLESPTEAVRGQVERLGYRVVSTAVDDEEKDIRVLSCVREGDSE